MFTLHNICVFANWLVISYFIGDDISKFITWIVDKHDGIDTTNYMTVYIKD